MTQKETIQVLQSIEDRAVDFPNMTACDWVAIASAKRHLTNSIEVKEVETWHLQEKEDIYDAVKDWSLQTFVCVMKDGTVQRFNGCLDEDCEGHINVHIDGINEDYDNVDDIVKWIGLT